MCNINPCIIRSVVFLFHIESRNMRKWIFTFLFLLLSPPPEKQDLNFCFSFRGTKMNKQLEYLITTHGRPAVLKVIGGSVKFPDCKVAFFYHDI